MKVLFEKGGMSFQEIVNSHKLGSNRNIVHRRLCDLIRRRIVHEEGGKEWRPGQKKLYNLTPKGKNEFLRSFIDNFNENVRVIEKISSELLQPPSKFTEWKKAIDETWFKLEPPEGLPMEEQIKYLGNEGSALYGPLLVSYRNLHEIISRLIRFKYHPKLQNIKLSISIAEDGGPHAIPVES